MNQIDVKQYVYYTIIKHNIHFTNFIHFKVIGTYMLLKYRLGWY